MANKVTLHNGDSAEVLKQYPDNHFDSIVTDPPYGIEFLGKEWDKNTGAIEVWQECLRVLKPGGHILAFSAARTYHRLATNLEDVGFEIRDQIMWIYGSGFPKGQDMGKLIAKRKGKNIENSSIDYRKDAQDERNVQNGGTAKGKKCNICGSGTAPLGVKCKLEEPNDCPHTKLPPKLNEWSGWKTGLKPAHEPIVMARKPFKGSTVDNVLQYGTGAINIDDTRVGIEDIGRYPSNVIGEIEGEEQKYFYCPKVSRKERNMGFDLKDIPTDSGLIFNTDTGIARAVQVQERNKNVTANNHPTVKPVALMKYLVTLVTPKGGKVLDPFNGSGSTGMAVKEFGGEYTGIDLDANYIEIANKRIEAWK